MGAWPLFSLAWQGSQRPSQATAVQQQCEETSTALSSKSRHGGSAFPALDGLALSFCRRIWRRAMIAGDFKRRLAAVPAADMVEGSCP